MTDKTMNQENYQKIRMKGEGTPPDAKSRGWAIPGVGFFDFTTPVTFAEAKLLAADIKKTMDDKQNDRP